MLGSRFYVFCILLFNANLSTFTSDGLSLNFTLLPQILLDNGYDTHMVGKWHVKSCVKYCIRYTMNMVVIMTARILQMV